MNVVDSSAWLEYFADGPNARFFAKAIEDSRNLAVPAVCVVEVFRRMMRQLGLDVAMRATAAMQRQGTVMTVDNPTAERSLGSMDTSRSASYAMPSRRLSAAQLATSRVFSRSISTAATTAGGPVRSVRMR